MKSPLLFAAAAALLFCTPALAQYPAVGSTPSGGATPGAGLPAYAAPVQAPAGETVTVNASGTNMMLTAPAGMCFFDPSRPGHDSVLEAMQASARADGKLLAAWGPCDMMDKIGKTNPNPGTITGGMILAGSPTNESAAAYAARIQPSFAAMVGDKVAQMQAMGAQLALDPNMRVWDGGVAVGYSGAISLPSGGTYQHAGVDATTLVRGIPLYLRYSLTDTQSAPLQDVYDMVQKSMMDLHALNGAP